MLIGQILSVQSIHQLDHADSPSQVIATLSATVARMLSTDAKLLERGILERERTRTTALPNGAAIPHCRMPALTRFGMGMMLLKQPLEWDRYSVDTVVLIAGPSSDVAGHLRILANTSQILDSSAIRAKLKLAPTAQAVGDLIGAAEEAIERRRADEGMLREIRKEQEPSDWLSTVADRFTW